MLLNTSPNPPPHNEFHLSIMPPSFKGPESVENQVSRPPFPAAFATPTRPVNRSPFSRFNHSIRSASEGENCCDLILRLFMTSFTDHIAPLASRGGGRLELASLVLFRSKSSELLNTAVFICPPTTYRTFSSPAWIGYPPILQ